MRNSGPAAPPAGHVTVGQVVGPQGLRGGFRVECLTDFPERFEPGRVVYMGGKPHKISSLAWHKGQARIEVEGVETVEAAEALRWTYLTVPADERPDLDDDEYLATDLIGLTAFDQHGKELGKVESVLPSPAHSLLIIAGVMVPSVSEFVKNIDLEHGRITIHVIPGLFDGEEAQA